MKNKATNGDKVRSRDTKLSSLSDENLCVALCEQMECSECPVNDRLDNRSRFDRAVGQITCAEANLLPWIKEKA